MSVFFQYRAALHNATSASASPEKNIARIRMVLAKSLNGCRVRISVFQNVNTREKDKNLQAKYSL